MIGAVTGASRGARVGSDLGPAAMTPDAIYDAFVVRRSDTHLAVTSWLGASVGTILGVGIALSVAATSGTGIQRITALTTAVAGIGMGQLLIRKAVPPFVQDAALAAAIVLLGYIGTLGGPLQPILPVLFVVLGTSFFVIRNLGYSLTQLSLMGACYAVALIYGPDVDAPVTRWVTVMAAVLISGMFVRWLVLQVAEVATAERAARLDAEAATEELRRLDASKGAFLARMSHELRTPLNVILGFSDVLRDGLAGPLDERQRSCVEDISGSGRDLLELVDQLLDLSKVEAGPGANETSGPHADDVVDPVLDRDIDRPFLVPSSRANRALIGVVGRWFSYASAVLLAAIAILTPGAAALRVGIGATAAVTVALGHRLGRSSSVMSELATDVVGLLGIVLISAVTLLPGPLSDLAPLAYGWNVLAAAALLSTARVRSRIVATAVVFGLVLLIDRPPGALQLWIAVLALVIANAHSIGWISARLHDVVSAVLSSRLAAETTRAQMEAVSAHKRDFLANTSHELRTPLNAIVGFAQVLDDEISGPLEPRQAEYVADILQTGQHLLALITDLLELAKLEAGRLPATRQPLLIAAVIDAAVTEHAHLARRRGIELRIEVQPDLPEIDGDPLHLHHALGHLLSNGIKFTDDGGAVDVMSHLDESGDRVLLSVRDTGIGIVADQQAHVFDAFHQGTRPLPEHARGGTGLGLTLARWLVELAGGTIAVESTPDIGSTFTIELPVPVLTPEAAVLA